MVVEVKADEPKDTEICKLQPCLVAPHIPKAPQGLTVLALYTSYPGGSSPHPPDTDLATIVCLFLTEQETEEW